MPDTIPITDEKLKELDALDVPSKLRLLADWFDLDDLNKSRDDVEVQLFLRRMAREWPAIRARLDQQAAVRIADNLIIRLRDKTIQRQKEYIDQQAAEIKSFSGRLDQAQEDRVEMIEQHSKDTDQQAQRIAELEAANEGWEESERGKMIFGGE